MADAADLKSAGLKPVWVRIPPDLLVPLSILRLCGGALWRIHRVFRCFVMPVGKTWRVEIRNLALVLAAKSEAVVHGEVFGRK